MSLTSLLKSFEEEFEVGVTPDLKFVEKDTGGFSLKGYLSRQRSKILREKKPMRMGVTFSPSTITYNYCRRIKVAQMAGKTELYYDKSPPSQQINFDMGNIIHAMIQQWFWDIGVLKADWYCIKCDRVYRDLVSPRACPSKKTSHGIRCLQHREQKVKSEPYRISGRPDGILVIKDREDELIDIKSIAAETSKTNERQFTFQDLEKNGPKDEHVVQLNLYMFCTRLKSGHLLYFNKNDGKIKTYHIPYDEDLIKPYLDEILHLIDLSERWKKGELEQGELPEPCGRKDCSCEEFLTKS